MRGFFIAVCVAALLGGCGAGTLTATQVADADRLAQVPAQSLVEFKDALGDPSFGIVCGHASEDIVIADRSRGENCLSPRSSIRPAKWASRNTLLSITLPNDPTYRGKMVTLTIRAIQLDRWNQSQSQNKPK